MTLPATDLGEECVQAMHFLPFLHKSVELRDPLERKFVHEVDDVRLLQKLVLERFHCHRERGRKEEDLTLLGEVGDESFHQRLELGREELVCLHKRKVRGRHVLRHGM